MFRDTLLESSASGRKRKRWPMTVAFALEAMVGAALIVLPLLSTGVIPVAARVSCPIATLGQQHATRPPQQRRSTGGTALARIVSLNPTQSGVTFGRPVSPSGSDDDYDGPPIIGSPYGLPNGLADPHGDRVVPQQEPPKRIRVSTIEEGQLINKVEPVYPRIAILSGTKGEVRLHAIIARDGTIQSLTVVSGHPLLIPPARDAVSRWRYRPYLLNGQPVEVETFITVSFK